MPILAFSLYTDTYGSRQEDDDQESMPDSSENASKDEEAAIMETKVTKFKE